MKTDFRGGIPKVRFLNMSEFVKHQDTCNQVGDSMDQDGCPDGIRFLVAPTGDLVDRQRDEVDGKLL